VEQLAARIEAGEVIESYELQELATSLRPQG
jgi:hypothetical protein